MQFDFTFEGNVADYPELRITPSGRSVARLRVGHNTRRRNSHGEWIKGDTIWFTVTAWEALAENIVESVRRGDTVTVTCRDDLSVFAYINQTSGKAAGELQVTAANIGLSMRFNAAESHRKPKQADHADPWATAAPYDNAYAEVVAEAAAEARAAAQAEPVPAQHAEDEVGSPAYERALAEGDEPAELVTVPADGEPGDDTDLDPELAAAALVG